MILDGLYGTISGIAEGRCRRPLKPPPAIDGKRQHPTDQEHADDKVTEVRKALVEIGDQAPKGSFEPELVRDQAKRLDPADQECNRHRNGGDREIVPELAYRIEESPTVGT